MSDLLTKFKVGDVVNGYYKGLFKLTKVVDRSGSGCKSPLHHAVSFDPVTGKLGKTERTWDAAYTIPADQYLNREILGLSIKLAQLTAAKDALK